jgi:amino acid transporter
MQSTTQKPARGASSAGTSVGPFERTASGLVREITAWQVFGFNVMNANIGIGLVWLTLLGPGLYPGANLYLAVLLAFVGILPLNFLYVRLAVAFPRSGGDYVSISRTLSPALGFAVNVAAMAYFCLFVGLGGLYTVQYGVTPLARVWAAYSGDPWALHLADRLATPTGTFVVSLAVLAAYALLMIRGGKLYFRAQTVAFVAGTTALAVVVAAGLLLSHSAALTHIDGALARLGAGPVAPLAAGSAVGFSWSATLHAAIWPWIVFVGCYFSVFIAGEVRRPARTQAIGVFGSLTWALLWMLVVVFALSHLFGQALFANLAAVPPDKLGLSSTPAFAELVALALHHAWLAVALMAAFTVWGFAWVGPTAMCVSRCLFAWSLDGLAPRWCAEVHRRWHTPHRALGLTFAVATVFTALMIYAHLSLLSGMIVMFIEWLCVALVAIVLPRVADRRGFVLPPAGRLWGLSTLTWCGLLTVPPVLVAAYLNLTDANSGTSVAHQPKALLLWLGILAACLAAYRVVAVLRERRGTSLRLACRVLPPD